MKTHQTKMSLFSNYDIEISWMSLFLQSVLIVLSLILDQLFPGAISRHTIET